MKFNEYILSEEKINDAFTDINIDDDTVDGVIQYYSYWGYKLKEIFNDKEHAHTDTLQTK